MAETQQQIPEVEVAKLEESEFESLLQKEFRPKSDEAKGAVEQAVRTLAEQALAQTQLIGRDVVKSIEAIIAELDRKRLLLHRGNVNPPLTTLPERTCHAACASEIAHPGAC